MSGPDGHPTWCLYAWYLFRGGSGYDNLVLTHAKHNVKRRQTNDAMQCNNVVGYHNYNVQYNWNWWEVINLLLLLSNH